MNGIKSMNPILVEIGKEAGVTFFSRTNGWFLDGNTVWETKAVDKSDNIVWLTDSQGKVQHFNGIAARESEAKAARFLMRTGSVIEVNVQPDWTLMEVWRSQGFSSLEELRMKISLKEGKHS